MRPTASCALYVSTVTDPEYSEVHYGVRPRAGPNWDGRLGDSEWRPGSQEERPTVALVPGFLAGDMGPALGLQGAAIFFGRGILKRFEDLSLRAQPFSQLPWPRGVGAKGFLLQPWKDAGLRPIVRRLAPVRTR